MLGAILLFDLLAYLVRMVGIVDVKPGAPWLIFTSFILFYILINGILSISTDNQNKYWLQSFIAYLGLMILGGLLSWLFAGISMQEAGSYRFILFLFTFCYVLILGITNAIRKIVHIAQKQDKRMRGEE